MCEELETNIVSLDKKCSYEHDEIERTIVRDLEHRNNPTVRWGKRSFPDHLAPIGDGDGSGTYHLWGGRTRFRCTLAATTVNGVVGAGGRRIYNSHKTVSKNTVT